MATSTVLMKFPTAHDETYGKISVRITVSVLSPENQAVWMNSRSRMVRATERICRAGHGQLKTIRTPLMIRIDARPWRSDASRIRIGSDGTTMNVSMRRLSARSVHPPLSPANTPTTTPITVAKKPTRTPRMSEFRSE